MKTHVVQFSMEVAILKSKLDIQHWDIKSRIVHVHTKSGTNVRGVISLLSVCADWVTVRGHLHSVRLWGGRWRSRLQSRMHCLYLYYISSDTVFNICGEMSLCTNPYFKHPVRCFYKHECVCVSRWAKICLSIQSTTLSNSNKCCRLPEVH